MSAVLERSAAKAIAMEKRSLQTSSGRRVSLGALHIQRFDRYYLEGRGDLIRAQVLADLPNEVRRVFPGRSAIFVAHCEGPGPVNYYPPLIMMCEFECSEPVGKDADCSSLIVVWFLDHWEIPISDFVAARINSIDWEQYAVDGHY